MCYFLEKFYACLHLRTHTRRPPYQFQLRTQLLEGDANSILGYLMRFPEMDDLTPIFRIARDVQR